jgi:hypothetical protein
LISFCIYNTRLHFIMMQFLSGKLCALCAEACDTKALKLVGFAEVRSSSITSDEIFFPQLIQRAFQTLRTDLQNPSGTVT